MAPDAEAVTSATFSFTTDACRDELRTSVSWEPTSYEVAAGGRSVAVDTVLRAKVVDDGGNVLVERARAGGALSFEKLVSANASVRLILSMDLGMDVRAHALVMGWVPASGPACPS